MITTAAGERARLSFPSGLICFQGNHWLDCEPEKLNIQMAPSSRARISGVLELAATRKCAR